MKKQIISISCLLGILLSQSQASQVIRMDLKALTQRAEIIAVGRCVSAESAWNEGQTQIYTTVTIQVSLYVKGFLGPKITFRQLGGTVGNRASKVPGMPEFKPEQEVIVFLAKDTLGQLQILGMSQGKYDVFTETESRTRTVRSSGSEGLRLLESGSNRGPNVAHPSGPIPLDSFLDQIRSHLD